MFFTLLSQNQVTNPRSRVAMFQHQRLPDLEGGSDIEGRKSDCKMSLQKVEGKKNVLNRVE